MALYDPRPLSWNERAQLAKKLRDEAAGKIAEAQRIEDGIAADKKELDDMLTAAMNKTPNA
ncbi:hypothetical protein GBK02_08990 [Dechloromonas sp. TW-R-39-2]|uniref:hypothetical protein n=1 Tax=Dechloromonas sp. TW-R-39-2 TaxID=2654218 RepID=UPI00193D2BD4|nr:hypothetical protein [Dechloromonas sp. TW-R-39-2]QRM19526.1 hypothetical protein GBK02_08990 [Dechloromonas sp. TW-R-39-2]